jgi:hypothetical protein
MISDLGEEMQNGLGGGVVEWWIIGVVAEA